MQFNGIRERMRLWPRSKRGAVLVFVAVVLVVALGFGALVVDLGFLTLTRTQLQSAADAAALAGALELAKSSGSKSSAESKAIEMAAYNKAFVGSKGSFRNSLAPVAITENDITFPEANSIRVETHRTDETNDPLRTYFLAITNTVSGRISEVTASAEASWVSICGASCLKPWCPPDRWYDADGDGEFDPYEEDDGKGKGKGKGKGGGGASEPDFYDPVLTGYKAPDDVGVQIQIKLSKQSEDMKSGYFYAVDFPPTNKGNPMEGGNRYRDWIQGCADSSFAVEIGDTLQIEPGNMKGPTRQGVASLIALDPNAEWDSQTDEVVGSDFTRSPRIVRACFFDPSIGLFKDKGRKRVQVVKIFAFFLEGVDSNGNVTGRFLRAGDYGSAVECEEPSPDDFLYSVRLTE